MTRAFAVLGLVTSVALIAVAYVSAFFGGGPPAWAPWCFALGVPGAIVGVMVLGAARGKRGGGIGRLIVPMSFVGLALASGFGLALALPADEGAASRLVLGLPMRAAIILYGIGLMPIVVLPIAYAMTFKTQTLNADDIERVRRAGEQWRAGQ